MTKREREEEEREDRAIDMLIKAARGIKPAQKGGYHKAKRKERDRRAAREDLRRQVKEYNHEDSSDT